MAFSCDVFIEFLIVSKESRQRKHREESLKKCHFNPLTEKASLNQIVTKSTAYSKRKI